MRPPFTLNPGFFPVQVTARSGSGDSATYSWQEVWRSQGGWRAKSGGRHGAAATNPGVPLPGAAFAVDDYALCRSAEGEGGIKWELFDLPDGSLANPADGSCAGVGWTAALTAADCVTVSELSAGGLCACASFAAFTLSSSDGQTWATAAPGGGVPTFTLCGTAGYAFAFRRGTGCDSRPCLTITGPAVGSGAAPVYSGVLECGGCNYAVFAFSAPVLCTGTRAATGPCDNLLRVKVEWTCCPVAGWAGAGWYCAKDADSPTACVAVELLDSDKCDGTITICSGPYATQSEAEAVCGGDPNTPMPCQSKSFASATASFANKTGDCTCLPDSPTVGATGVDSCTIATAGCPGNVGLTLSCSGGQYALTSTGGLTVTPVYFSAGPPLVLAWDITGYAANCGAGGGGARLVITVP
jgi:hypothetical protein